MNIVIIGAGRAGLSFDSALRAAGHHVSVRHHSDLGDELDSDIVLLCVPDDAIELVAQNLQVSSQTVVAHCAGSRTLSVLEPHDRVGSLHPLVALTSAEVGAHRLVGATYCVSGDEILEELVSSLNGRVFTLSDANRAAYHATACVAANHLVVLMSHVAQLAHNAGLSLTDFMGLAHNALDDVVSCGPAAALTGPASRGDLSTIDAHLAAIPESERQLYVALANRALALAEQTSPAQSV